MTLANVRAEALLYALADTGAEVEAEALYVLKPYAEVEDAYHGSILWLKG